MAYKAFKAIGALVPLEQNNTLEHTDNKPVPEATWTKQVSIRRQRRKTCTIKEGVMRPVAHRTLHEENSGGDRRQAGFLQCSNACP